MDSIEMKELVSSAMKQQWEEFAARHPALAKAMDQEMLTERCMRELSEDEQYREALKQVREAPLFACEMQRAVLEIARAWLLRI